MTKDDYETPQHVWDMILPHIDKKLTIYEPFYCNGRSGAYIKSKGYTCIHEDRDFFNWEPAEHYDIIISNPPFSKKAEVFARLKEMKKPFALLVPIITLGCQYFHTLFGDEVKLLFPTKRVQFIKDGVATKKCNFDVVFVCVGIDAIKKDIQYISIEAKKLS